MNVLFYAVWFSWFLSEFLVNRLFRSKLKDSKDLDKGSVRLIWITIMTSMVVGVFCSNRFHFPIYQYESITYIGLGLILTGMIIRFMAIRTLGASFTVDLAVKEEQKLITTGLYKYIRHPSYSGSLLSFAGFSMTLNNWLSMAVILIPVTSVIIYRINLEEKLLLSVPGMAYSEYVKKTSRLIPWIY